MECCPREAARHHRGAAAAVGAADRDRLRAPADALGVRRTRRARTRRKTVCPARSHRGARSGGVRARIGFSGRSRRPAVRAILRCRTRSCRCWSARHVVAAAYWAIDALEVGCARRLAHVHVALAGRFHHRDQSAVAERPRSSDSISIGIPRPTSSSSPLSSLLCWTAYRRSLSPEARAKRIGWLIPVGLVALQIGFALIQNPAVKRPLRQLLAN